MTTGTAHITERSLKTSRLTVHHLRTQCAQESAPRVLFLGGSNFDLRLKRNFLTTQLVKHCNVATYEPRGIGRTEHPAGEWTMRGYAEDAVAVLDAVGWTKAHIVGESFGGMTALHVAVMEPEKVQSLTIASATAGGAKHSSYNIAQFVSLSRIEAAEKAVCLQDTRNSSLRSSDPKAFAKILAQRQVFENKFADPSHINGGRSNRMRNRRS